MDTLRVLGVSKSEKRCRLGASTNLRCRLTYPQSPSTGETISPHSGGCAPRFSVQSLSNKLLESCWKRMAPFGLRGGWTGWDAHHVTFLLAFVYLGKAEAVFHSTPAIR